MDIKTKLMEVYKEIRQYGKILADLKKTENGAFIRYLIIEYDKGGKYNCLLRNGEIAAIIKLD